MGQRATACSPRARSGRCSTSPDQLGGELPELCRAGAGREELFRALLRQLSAPGVLDVVVVEDVHWADEATLDLLRYLGRRLRDAAVLLIVTYRDDGLAADRPAAGRRSAISATQRRTRRRRRWRRCPPEAVRTAGRRAAA